MVVFQEIKCPTNCDSRWLSRQVTSKKEEGEYSWSPVNINIVDKWLAFHPDFTHSLQYSDKCLTISITHRLFDGVAGIIASEVVGRVAHLLPAGRARIFSHTGLTRLENDRCKNGDAHIYSHHAGVEPEYPGVVIECGFSDTLQKSRRDITLWLDNSELNVRTGIAAKIKLAADKTIETLKFEIYEIDEKNATRTSPLGRAWKVTEMDFSQYDGTPATLPPVSTWSIPSHHIFSDGTYPAAWPNHPNPPPFRPAIMDNDFSLSSVQKKILVRERNLSNSQRLPVDIDFSVIADEIRCMRFS